MDSKNYLTRNEFLKAMKLLQDGLTKTLKENNKAIFAELKGIEERNQARFETLLSASKLNKLEFVTRQEFDKLKRQVSRLRAN